MTYYYPNLRYRINYPYNDYNAPPTSLASTGDLLLLKSDELSLQSRFIDESVASLGMTSGVLSSHGEMTSVIDDLSESISDKINKSKRSSIVDPSDFLEDDLRDSIAPLTYPLEDVIGLFTDYNQPSPEDYLEASSIGGKKKLRKLQWSYLESRCGSVFSSDKVLGLAVICHSTDGGKYAIMWWKDGEIRWCKAKRVTVREKEKERGTSFRKKLGFGGKKTEWDEETSPGILSLSSSGLASPSSSRVNASLIPSVGSTVHSIKYENVVALDKGANTPPFVCARNVQGERCFSILTEEGSLDIECFKGERDVIVTSVMETLKKARGEGSGSGLEAV
ncbi:hypothetical protein TrVE_jg12332 [Triparma verrucosa]|uniref:Uncharacterized protein n=1 Tax=Triparma verrucosa TaxID=1606542 RepID=A0A9W7BCP5_9STRA|nr:hypothetical protein TrVE_jg12332 [Triparma verrucosa]